MSGIKVTAADGWFSKCIRARANWTCQRCGAVHASNSRGLHCSHHHSRRNWGIRFEPLNCEALCYGCHALVGGTQERREEVMTQQERELLIELKNDTNRGREYKRTPMKDLAAHYRAEFARMQLTGSRVFVGYI